MDPLVLLNTIGIRLTLFLTIALLIVYHFVLKTWNFFLDKNVKFVRGIPILGSQYRTPLLMEPWADTIVKHYNLMPNEKIFGSFEIFGLPVYTIRDPELLQQVAIKDFEYFMNHLFQVEDHPDPREANILFFLQDQRWRNMRAALSPIFTGSKMRLMFDLILEVCQALDRFLKSDIPSEGKIYNVKDIYMKVANDVIATCVFGLNIDTFQDKNDEFYRAGRVLSTNNGMKGFKCIAYATVPKIMKFLKVNIMEEKEKNYFLQIVKENMDYREEHNIIRNDMINLLMEIKRGTMTQGDEEADVNMGYEITDEKTLDPNFTKVQKWSDDDLLGQCLLFFVAGLSSISTTLSFATNAITVNQQLQEKLYREISEAKKKLNGKPLTYDVLQSIKYLDMIILETLRMWPQVICSDRRVNKPYVINHDNGTQTKLGTGDVIIFPVLGFHMDPKYHPNPQCFDPERFNDENKKKIIPGTFMPFGIGPRMCIASRFAMMECKSALYQLVSKFHLEKCDRTEDVPKIRLSARHTEPANGVWIKLRPRK